jgi:hypothetical protein
MMVKCTFGLMLLPLVSNKKKIIDTISKISEFTYFYSKPMKYRTEFFDKDLPIAD